MSEAKIKTMRSFTWLAIICACLIAMMGFGPRSVMGFFQLPMLQDTGWDRSALAPGEFWRLMRFIELEQTYKDALNEAFAHRSYLLITAGFFCQRISGSFYYRAFSCLHLRPWSCFPVGGSGY